MASVALVGFAGLVVGFSKTSLGGLSVIATVIFASAMPARASTGALLAVLIVGDVVAVTTYRRSADWTLVRSLLPAIVPGLIVGAVFLRLVDDTTLRRSIGLIILILLALQLWLLLRRTQPLRPIHPRAASWLTGVAAGFTTMTANAAGAVITLFLVAKGVDKQRFLGTMAWFFLGINLSKVPFSVALGLLGPHDILRAVELAPLVIAGGWLGWHAAQRLTQRSFEMAVILASAIGAVTLVVR